jgi:hypothetical protein
VSDIGLEGLGLEGLVRQVSGEWKQGVVRLRFDAGKQPQDLLIAPPDMQSLIDLLLVLSGAEGPGAQHDTTGSSRVVRTLPLDSAVLGETDENGAVLELNVGRIALAFFLPIDACRSLGQTLLTISAARTQMTN